MNVLSMRVMCLACVVGLGGLLMLSLRAADPAGKRERIHRIHVSPNGNDAGDGTQAKPFRTVHRAQEAARQALAAGGGDVIVEIGEGTYRLDRPLGLTPADSGREGSVMVYRSRDGIGKACLYGSVPVTDWQPYRDGIWRTQLPEGTVFHTLYEGGRRAHKARFPDAEHLPEFPCARGRYLLTEDGTPKRYHRGGDAPEGPGWLIYPEADPPPQPSGSKTKVLIYTGGHCDWNRSMYEVRSIDPTTRRLVFEAKRLPFGVGRDARFFLEDDLSFLDAPGEFYIDESSDTLYYRPMGEGSPDQLAVTRPVINRLIQIEGTSHDVCVSGVRVEGLALAETDCSPVRPLWAYHGHIDGALIWLSNASGIEIRNCHLKNSGRHGVMMVGHNTGNLVTGCLIEHMGLNGVSFANRFRGPDRTPTPKRCEGNRVYNTRISHVGEIHSYAECVTVFHASRNEVAHCVLDNSVRYAITVRGNTGAQYGPPVTNTFPPSAGNHFHHIRVFRCGQDGGDMGALHCANLNNPGGEAVNTFEQITVADTRAVPSVKDIAPNGIFLDWPKMAMHQVFRNVHIIRSQGGQLRSNGPDNGASAQTENVSWKPGFRPDLMAYDSIGLTDSFPAEFDGRPPRPVPPPAPRDVRVSAPAHHSVVLTWEAPDHEFLERPVYTVFRDGDVVGQVSRTTFRDMRLTERTTYRYEVTARDGDFCHAGPRSAVCEIRTPPDRIPPTVQSAWSLADGEKVRVLFSKPMAASALCDPSNYRFSPEVSVVAVREISSDCVELRVKGLDADEVYTLTISGLTDRTPARNELVDAGAVPVSARGREACFDMRLSEDGLLLDRGGGVGNARLFGGAAVREGLGPSGGPALVLDGESSYVEAPSVFDLGAGDFTIMLWLRRQGGGHILLSKGNGFGSPEQWSLGWPGNDLPGSISFRVNNEFYSTASRAIPRDEWVHVAFVCRGRQGRFYVNGESSGGVHDLAGLGALVNEYPLRIGRRAHEPDPQYFKGMIAALRITDYPLSEEEIRAAVQAGRMPTGE